MLLPPCLFFICAFCLWEWVGSAPVERSEQCHTESVGVLFLVPSVCDGHEWAVWSVSFFLLVGCPFLWLECIFTLLTLLSPPVIWSDHVSVVCCAEQVGFSLALTPQIVKEHLSTELLYGEDRTEVGCMDLTAPVCVLIDSNQVKSLSVSCLWSWQLFVCPTCLR